MYPGSLTRLVDAALATQHLLVKVGSDADHIAAMAAVTDVPIGTCPDTPDAAEDSAAVHLLGSYPGTITMVADGEVVAGERVFAGADGKVTDLPAVPGTYFCVGTAITGATDAEIEVDSCIPYPVVVT